MPYQEVEIFETKTIYMTSQVYGKRMGDPTVFDSIKYDYSK